MFRRVGRILLVVFCVAMVAQETSLGSLLFGTECCEDCRGDSGSRRCSPGCTTCSCAGHGSLVSLDTVTPSAERLPEAPAGSAATPRILEPRPDAIFHVPRPSAA